MRKYLHASAAFLLSVLWLATASAFDSPETYKKFERNRRFQRNGVTQRWQTYRKYLDMKNYEQLPKLDAPNYQLPADLQASIVQDVRSGGSLLGALDADTVDSPGLRIGLTSYDSQANNAIGREIASRPGSDIVHFVYTMWDRIPVDADENDRFVNYNSFEKSTATLNGGFNGTAITLGDFARGGFCKLDVDGAGYAKVSLHQDVEADFPTSVWFIDFPLLGSSLHLDQELPKPPANPDETDLLWPDIAVEVNSVDGSTDIYHIISSGGVDVGSGNANPSDRLWYYRYDGGAVAPAWEGPVLVDSSTVLGYTIDADDNSNSVCLAFTSNYSTDGLNQINNVVYRESVTSGSGWLSGAELGELNKNFITSFSSPVGPQAWTETSVAYDNNSDLHILFTEQRIANTSVDIAIRHWSRSRGTIRPVQLAYYDNDATWLRTANLGHISLGIGDGSTSCKGGAETNLDYLYATFTQLGGTTQEEQDDMSQLGFANGEIWFTASNSGGTTWSPPINLTNTKSPDCTTNHPDSVCASEAWGSIARDVKDIELLYIRDFEAGSFSEAPWAIGNVMYLSLPGGTVDADFVCPTIAPNFQAFVTSIPECEYHANPGAVNTEELSVINLGNDLLSGDVSVTQGGSWLSVTAPGAYAIPAGGADIVMDVNMDATVLSEDLYIGEIQVTHNDTSKASPRVFPIEFFVVQGFKCPQNEVLKTAVASPGVLSLTVASNARFAQQATQGGLWRYEDSSSTIFDASLLLAHGAQGSPDTIVFHRFYNNNNDPGQQGWRALTDLEIDTSSYSTGGGFAKASANMTTADSLIAVKVEWFFPQGTAYGDFVVAKYTVSNRTASPISDVAVGIWADVDAVSATRLAGVQDAGGNHGNFVAAQNLIYQYGYDSIGHVTGSHLNSSQRYSGGVSYLSGRDATGATFHMSAAPMRGAVGDNRENQGVNRPNSGQFYRALTGAAGVSIWEPTTHPDSSKDAFLWLGLDQGRTLDANGANPEVYVVAWVSDTLQHPAYALPDKNLGGGLAEVVDSAWAWAAANAFCACANHHDPQVDGLTNVLDVVKTVNVAFKGAAPVFDDDCPYERTDVDCTGFTNVLDVVKMVNVAFKGGNPATNFCDGCTD